MQRKVNGAKFLKLNSIHADFILLSVDLGSEMVGHDSVDFDTTLFNKLIDLATRPKTSGGQQFVQTLLSRKEVLGCGSGIGSAFHGSSARAYDGAAKIEPPRLTAT
jgi:hypothetical protein